MPKSKVRKDVEKSEESENFGGLHPANKSHRARKFGHRAPRQSSRYFFGSKFVEYDSMGTEDNETLLSQ